MKIYYIKTVAKAIIDSLIYTAIVMLLIFYNNFGFTSYLLYLLLIGIVIRIIGKLILKIYQDLSPFSGVVMIFKMAAITFVAYVIQFIFARFVFSDAELIKISSPTILPFLVLTETFLLVLYRYWRRIIRSLTQYNRNTNKTLIIGAGDGAKLVVDEIANNKNMNNNIIGYVDDDKNKIGRFFRGKRIIGTTESVERIIRQFEVQEIIISTINFPDIKFQKLLQIADKYHVVIKRVGQISGEGTAYKIKPLSIDELLNRESVRFDVKEINEFLFDKSVIVTGAGGSIGSELCRQILSARPKTLILFDIYENSTYDIQLELLAKTLGTEIITIIGSTYNEKRVDDVFKKYKPNLVFHAAAYKHVPLMEHNSVEAIRTNVIGTYNVAKAADKYGVTKMVLVSTDKAVRPTNVMGATKRLAEIVIQHFSTISKTSYSAVRFGNVLGSNGSVVPLFRKQIENGGPITITHPEINRFFMTIPEAVSLILQSGVYADKGEIFILDMGEPVKINDLARKMVVQAGLIPDKDIKFIYTGLRPGEKLYEELLLNTNEHIKTPNKKIYIEESTTKDSIDGFITKIKSTLDQKRNSEIKAILAELVDTYTAQY